MMDSYHGILYVGDAGRGRALHSAAGGRGWYVYVPIGAIEALGIYIFYSPSVVVIEAGSDFAGEVFRHLRSVEAEPLLILADKAQEMEWTSSRRCQFLARMAGTDEIIAAVTNLLESREPAAV